MSQVPTLLTATQIREAMDEISGELESSGEVYKILQGPNGFKLAVSPDYAEWVRLLRNDPRPQKLTQAALETLAIIAYRQPVTRAEIEAIRGVNADSAIARLSDRDLIQITGRADLPGRPLQYGTTAAFLEFIGATSIEELPASDVLSPNQISEWIRRASNPHEIKNEDVGLPSADQGSGQAQLHMQENSGGEGEGGE
ncbi:MAG: SMC-Scp complex subunit ScpB [Opitutales bacterium]|nr:SMC-Scp complex subunit ScpB [Opitutales bacterium]